MYQKGDVVFVRFPFSDLSDSKMRPALIVWAPKVGSDPGYLLMQITSVATSKYEYLIMLTADDLKAGSLPKPSVIRPDKLFTSNGSTISRTIGSVTDLFLQQVIDSLKMLLDA